MALIYEKSSHCPPEIVIVDKVSTPNSAHMFWIKQDQHTASWIMATLSESILGQVIEPNYISAHFLWSKLEHLCVFFQTSPNSKP